MCSERSFNMITMIMVVVLTAVAEAGAVQDVTDEQYLKFPRLYHLDDYEQCLLRQDGVFCLGTFHVAPLQGHHHTYRLMKPYSDNTFALNRTRLHRGYCLTTRCPSVQGAGSPSQRFERCAAKWGARRGVNLRLASLSYCRTHQQFVEKSRWKVEHEQRLLLVFVAAVLALNVLGSLFELFGGKWKPLVVWSTLTNFVRLFEPRGDDGGRRRSTLTLEGGKVLLLWFVIFINAGATHTKLYLQNPRFLDQVYRHPIVQYLLNTNLALQIVIMVSSFLLAETMLRERRRPTFIYLIKLILRHIVRICPVHVFTIWYAGTWWPLARGGPQWHHVEREAQVCRDKLWSSAFFIDNFTGDDRQCLQTWYISVYMQLSILAAIVTWSLLRTRRPLTILTLLTITTCAVTAVVAYTRDWKPFAAFGGPENIRFMYAKEFTNREWYVKPWGSVTACLIGLTLAFLQRQLIHSRLSTSGYQWLSRVSHVVFPVVVVWAGVGRAISTSLGRAARAVCLALDAPALCLAVATFLIHVSHITEKRKSLESNKKKEKQGFLGNFFSWWMWYPLARVSLSMVTLHGVINSVIAFSRPALFNACLLDWIVDFVGTASYAYLSAATVTLLLDMPIQRLFD